MPAPTPSSRDAELRRISRGTRWTIAGGLAVSGVLGAVAAEAYSGSSSSVSTDDGERTLGNDDLIRATTTTTAPPSTRPSSPTPTTSAAPVTNEVAQSETPQPPAVRPSNRRSGARSGGS